MNTATMTKKAKTAVKAAPKARKPKSVIPAKYRKYRFRDVVPVDLKPGDVVTGPEPSYDEYTKPGG